MVTYRHPCLKLRLPTKESMYSSRGGPQNHVTAQTEALVNAVAVHVVLEARKYMTFVRDMEQTRSKLQIYAQRLQDEYSRAVHEVQHAKAQQRAFREHHDEVIVSGSGCDQSGCRALEETNKLNLRAITDTGKDQKVVKEVYKKLHHFRAGDTRAVRTVRNLVDSMRAPRLDGKIIRKTILKSNDYAGDKNEDNENTADCNLQAIQGDKTSRNGSGTLNLVKLVDLWNQRLLSVKETIESGQWGARIGEEMGQDFDNLVEVQSSIHSTVLRQDELLFSSRQSRKQLRKETLPEVMFAWIRVLR